MVDIDTKYYYNYVNKSNKKGSTKTTGHRASNTRTSNTILEIKGSVKYEKA